MAQDDSARRGGHREVRKSPDLASRYLGYTRGRRLAGRRTRTVLGWRFFLALLVTVGTSMLAISGLGIISVVQAYTTDLPPVTDLSSGTSFKTTQILDRNGKLLYEVNDQNGGKRLPIDLASISPDLIRATIATEDRTFYDNPGVDPIGIARAAYEDFVAGQLNQGGSTITQQLAKNRLIAKSERTDKSYVRKIQEMVLAFRISESYSKDQILQMYLDEVYYGHLSYGIEAAAETYFGTHARNLDLAQASLLAGLPQAPSDYDPFVHLQAAKDRQSHVLDRMVAQGYITQPEAEHAYSEPLLLRQDQSTVFQAPHFVMYVRQLLEQQYGSDAVYSSGLKVTTTLDLSMNDEAQKAIQAHADALAKLNANNAAVVAMDPKTGEILAMVGSRDYFDHSIQGEVNMATSPRQPGSTIKPIEYSLAFMKGWGPETVVLDSPTAFPNTSPALPPYQPHNFDNKFDGPMTVRWALANSKNIPAVKALMFDGIPDFLRYAGELGINFDNPSQYGLSLALGGGAVSLLNMVGAYSGLDNYGVYHQPVAILKVEDWQGNVLQQYQPTEGEQVIGPQQAYEVTSILSDNWARTPLEGPDSPLKLTIPAAAKTGSTDDYKDSWTIGYTPDLVTGVWVGNTDDRPMNEVLGVLGAGHIWNSFMEDVHQGKATQDFTPPPGITEYRLCQDTGRPAGPGCGVVIKEAWPRNYTPAQYSDIPGLPGNSSDDLAKMLAGGKGVLGQTVSPQGIDLQPTSNQHTGTGP